jgi:hypothetical protein
VKKVSQWLPLVAVVITLVAAGFIQSANSKGQQSQKSGSTNPATSEASGQHGIGHIDVMLCTGTIRQNCQHAASPTAGSRGETSTVSAKPGKAIQEAWLTPTGDFKDLSAFDLIEVSGTNDGNITFILKAAGTQKNVGVSARVYFVFQE